MRRLLLGPVMLLAVAPLLLGSAPARAACTLPNVTVTPNSGPRGSSFEVRGDNWFRSCPDAGTPQPEIDVALTFEQAGKLWEIGTAHASPAGKIYAKVYVPDGDGVAERPYGQVPTDGGAQVRARGSAAEAVADYTITPGSSNDDNNDLGVQPGRTTTTRPGTTTTVKGATTTTVRKPTSSTTTTEKATTSTSEEATSSTTELKPQKTTTTTDRTETVAAGSGGDDGPSDGIRILAAVLAVAGIIAVVGYLLYQSRGYDEEEY